jgi:acyl carrier protein
MTRKVLSALEPIFQEVFEESSLVLTRELSADDVENWDSLNHIALIVEIEILTNLSFSTDELLELGNVGDFIDLLILKGFHGEH